MSDIDTPGPGEFDTPEPYAKPAAPSRLHRGIKIEFEKSNFRFKIANDDFTGDRWHDSFEAACKVIDAEHAAAAKLIKDSRKLAIPMLTSDGQEITVTGINRTNGEVSVTGIGERSYSGEMFPPVQWVKDTLLKLKAARAEVTRLENSLRTNNGPRYRLSVSGKRKSYGKLAAERYGAFLDELEAEATDSLKAALDKAPKVEAAE